MIAGFRSLSRITQRASSLQPEDNVKLAPIADALAPHLAARVYRGRNGIVLTWCVHSDRLASFLGVRDSLCERVDALNEFVAGPGRAASVIRMPAVSGESVNVPR